MIRKIVLIFALVVVSAQLFAISPYFYYGQLNTSTSDAVISVSKALSQNNFEIIGTYQPEGNSKLNVIAFTNKEIKQITFALPDRAALASVMKVAIIEKEGKPTLYLLNPEYIFWAYLRKQMDKTSVSLPLKKINDTVKNTLELFATIPDSFGGNIDFDDLKTYHYMFGMERFSDPVELNTFSTFKSGVEIITNNISQGKSNTKLVYKIIDDKNQTAIFGIGLLDNEVGEPNFLPIIGEDHAAALPYEIIVQNNKATILHGRYRIALHWPELTMVTFSKIMSTPGNIEEQLQSLTVD